MLNINGHSAYPVHMLVEVSHMIPSCVNMGVKQSKSMDVGENCMEFLK